MLVGLTFNGSIALRVGLGLGLVKEIVRDPGSVYSISVKLVTLRQFFNFLHVKSNVVYGSTKHISQ